jgi:hypothetical protein
MTDDALRDEKALGPKIPVEIEGAASEDGHHKWKMKTPDGPMKALDTPAAKEYAENILLVMDMRESIAAMECWERRFAESTDPEDALIALSLFRDAIVQFVGCFDKTAKFPLDAKTIYGDSEGGVESLQWFKDIRDAYAAHKFGAQRQCSVGVVSHDGQRDVGQIWARYRGQTKAEGPMLRGFMQKAADYLVAHMQELGKKVQEEIRQMSDEDVAKLSDAGTRTLKMEEARFTRADLDRDKPAAKR